MAPAICPDCTLLVRPIFPEETGFSFPVYIPWLAALLIAAASLLTATVAGLGPALYAVRMRIPEARDGFARIALIRREELDGFVEALCSEKSKTSNFDSEPIAPSTYSLSCARYSTASTSSLVVRKSP